MANENINKISNFPDGEPHFPVVLPADRGHAAGMLGDFLAGLGVSVPMSTCRAVVDEAHTCAVRAGAAMPDGDFVTTLPAGEEMVLGFALDAAGVMVQMITFGGLWELYGVVPAEEA